MLIQKQSQIQKQMTVRDPACMYAKQISKTKTAIDKTKTTKRSKIYTIKKS